MEPETEVWDKNDGSFDDDDVEVLFGSFERENRASSPPRPPAHPSKPSTAPPPSRVRHVPEGKIARIPIVDTDGYTMVAGPRRYQASPSQPSSPTRGSPVRPVGGPSVPHPSSRAKAKQERRQRTGGRCRKRVKKATDDSSVGQNDAEDLDAVLADFMTPAEVDGAAPPQPKKTGRPYAPQPQASDENYFENGGASHGLSLAAPQQRRRKRVVLESSDDDDEEESKGPVSTNSRRKESCGWKGARSTLRPPPPPSPFSHNRCAVKKTQMPVEVVDLTVDEDDAPVAPRAASSTTMKRKASEEVIEVPDTESEAEGSEEDASEYEGSESDEDGDSSSSSSSSSDEGSYVDDHEGTSRPARKIPPARPSQMPWQIPGQQAWAANHPYADVFTRLDVALELKEGPERDAATHSLLSELPKAVSKGYLTRKVHDPNFGFMVYRGALQHVGGEELEATAESLDDESLWYQKGDGEHYFTAQGGKVAKTEEERLKVAESPLTAPATAFFSGILPPGVTEYDKYVKLSEASTSQATHGIHDAHGDGHAADGRGGVRLSQAGGGADCGTMTFVLPESACGHKDVAITVRFQHGDAYWLSNAIGHRRFSLIKHKVEQNTTGAIVFASLHDYRGSTSSAARDALVPTVLASQFRPSAPAAAARDSASFLFREVSNRGLRDQNQGQFLRRSAGGRAAGAAKKGKKEKESAKKKAAANSEKGKKDRAEGGKIGGPQAVNTSHGSGKFSKLNNLYAKFEYRLKDDPTKLHEAICKYSPANASVNLEEIAASAVNTIKLSYFHAVAGMFPAYIGKKSPPKLSAVKPGKEGSILAELRAVEWLRNYVRLEVKEQGGTSSP